jgi:hypothetical protein
LNREAILNEPFHLKQKLPERKNCFQGRIASQPISIKGITGLGISEFESKLEPTHSLSGTPMGKSVWDHVSLGLSLDPIITDCAGSV